MKENNIDLKNVVVHAPYIINLANTIKEETFELAVNFLKQELQRCAKHIILQYGVLHEHSSRSSYWCRAGRHRQRTVSNQT